MSKRNLIGLLLVILSLVLLVPGLILPMVTLKVNAMGITIYAKTQSIVQAAQTLYQNDNTFTAFLILFFSILVPFLKALILLVCFVLKNNELRQKLFTFIVRIGKWSMADVFVVGTLIAYLAGKGTSELESGLNEGFYYFTAYCLVSILALEFLRFGQTKAT